MNEIETLRQLAQGQTEPMAWHILPDGLKVWLRIAGARNPLWLYRLLGALVAVLRLPVLRPVPNLGGSVALQTEARRLRELAASGVCVPDVLAIDDAALMLSDVGGQTVEAALRDADAENALTIWCTALAAIAQVHEKQQYLSQAFARNMLWRDDATVAFIDFEDDPATVLPLAHCQCRDWLCYLHSTIWLLENKGLLQQAQAIWAQYWARFPDDVRHDLQQTLRPIGFLRRINRPTWGKDVLKIAALARFME